MRKHNEQEIMRVYALPHPASQLTLTDRVLAAGLSPEAV